MEYQKTEKAYSVAHKDEINNDYHPEWPGRRVYAETAKKAIQKYWRDIGTDYEYRLIDIRAKRTPGADRYLFEGESMVMGEIERITEYRQWRKDMAEMIEANPTAKVRIWSGQWSMYWRPDRCGYTNKIEEAGLYKIQDAWNAVSHVGIEKKITFIIEPTGASGQICA